MMGILGEESLLADDDVFLLHELFVEVVLDVDAGVSG